MADLNPQLQALFHQHGVQTIALEQKALLLTRQPALLQSRITLREYPNGTSSQLDVKLDIQDRELVESFGDIGETTEEAIANNLGNFARNSLHVLLAALQDTSQDEQISIEDWTIAGQQWKVYLGNYGGKSTKGMPLPIPETLFPQLKSHILGLPLGHNYHWCRFFISCHNAQISALEFLFDNENMPQVEQALTTLDWRLTPEFYSIRLFLMLQKIS